MVNTEITNTGEHAFRTPFYSHHFLNVNRRPTGPPLEVSMDLDLRNYTEPLAPKPSIPKKDWSEPLTGYFAVGERGGWLRATRPVGNNSRLKAVFARPPGRSSGRWAVRSPGEVSMDVNLAGPLPLYAYNLYVEERTLSPEPIHVVQLRPGESANFTHTVALSTALLATVLPPGGWQQATHAEIVKPASQPQPQPASSWPLFGMAGAVLVLALFATALVMSQRQRHPLHRGLLAEDEGEYQLAEPHVLVQGRPHHPILRGLTRQGLHEATR